MPFVFATGYDRASVPERYAHIIRCEKPIDPVFGMTELGMVAANALARAIARGVFMATALPFPGALPAWKDRFG